MTSRRLRWRHEAGKCVLRAHWTMLWTSLSVVAESLVQTLFATRDARTTRD